MPILAPSYNPPPTRQGVDVGAYTLQYQRTDGSFYALDGSNGIQVQAGAQGLDGSAVTFLSDQPAGWDGELVHSISTDPLKVFLPMLFRSDTLAGLRALKESLTGYLNPAFGPVTLRVGLPNGTGRLIDGFYKGPLSTAMDTDTWFVNGQKVGATIRCGQPFWRDETPWSVTWAVPTSTSAILPILPLAPGSSSVLGNVNPVTVPGNVQTYPVWTLTGPMTACTVADVGAGVSFTFTHSIAAGVSYTIDCRRGRQGVIAPDGTRQRALLNPGAVLFPLRPGVSRIQTTVTGSTAGTTVTGTAPTLWFAA